MYVMLSLVASFRMVVGISQMRADKLWVRKVSQIHFSKGNEIFESYDAGA